MRYVYVGNVGGHWAENTHCPKCKKIIVERSAFSILADHIVQGKCKFCGEKIPGVWR
jgi:pyruvate formate lyase activating enzyme